MKTVDDYLADVPAARLEVLRSIRRLSLDELTGYVECIECGGPGYKRPDGEVEVGFASRKQYIALYILRQDALAKHRERLGKLSVGKGVIRYRRPDQVDLDVVRDLLVASRESTGEIC